jgi:hypothetical protein
MLLEQISIIAFIVNNGIRTETGEPLEFHTHRYLYDIYRDNSKYLCSIKAGQIGFSQMAILKTLWMAKNRKLNVGYILPTVEMVQKFVGSKVNPMATQNPVLLDWMKDKDSVTQKQVGESFIHYLGAQTERSAIMLSLDMLVADEYDKAPQNILETYDSRLQHSKFGYKWVFSNPTSPDFGVDKYWRISDQKKWHVTHSCKEVVLLDESTINYEKEIFECPKCKKEITDEERRTGEWIATSKGEWSGYWIPLWINPQKSAKDIKALKQNKTAEYFANFVAGLPYIGSGNKVSAQTIIQCLQSKTNDQADRPIIGVDTGVPYHFVVANKKGYFYYGKLSDPSTGRDPAKELEGLLARWPSSIIVSDANGDLTPIRLLRQKYPGRVFMCFYRILKNTGEVVEWGTGDKYGEVSVNRNKAIQQFIDEMTEKRHTFNGTESDWHDYITHWLNIYREWEYDDSGLVNREKGFKWERNGADHWVHATIYARVGLEKFQEQMAQVVGDSLLDSIPVGTMGNETMKEWDALNEYNKKWF